MSACNGLIDKKPVEAAHTLLENTPNATQGAIPPSWKSLELANKQRHSPTLNVSTEFTVIGQVSA